MLDKILENGFKKNIENVPMFQCGLNAYYWLAQQQTGSGEIIDPFINRSLPSVQYATSFYGLTGILLYLIYKKDEYLIASKKAFHYWYQKIENVPTTADNVFAYLVSLYLLKTFQPENSFISELSNMVSNLKHSTTAESTEGNNNYLQRLICDYILNQINDNDNTTIVEEIKVVIKRWQLTDGIYYDYPRQPKSDNEILISLPYHARITFLVLFLCMFCKDEEILKSGLSALESMTKFISVDGETFYFGRSMNSIFAYANGIAAYAIGSNLPCYWDESRCFNRDDKAISLLFSCIQKWQYDDGHLAIVPNKLENERCGYEQYMYSSVYNSYASALLIFSAICCSPSPLLGEGLGEVEFSNVNKTKYNYLESSGFLFVDTGYYSTAINLKPRFFVDHRNGVGSGPTYAGHSLLFLKSDGIDWLPSLPINQKTIKSNYYTEYDPTLAGFYPYSEVNKTS